MHRRASRLVIFAAPATAVFLAFWLLPVAYLAVMGARGPQGLAAYADVLVNPLYWRSLANTVVLSLIASGVSLVLALPVGRFLARYRQFAGRRLLLAMIAFPLAFPGVVVGFLVILLAGRQGLIGLAGSALFGVRPVFAYGLGGLFVGYLYFSLPRAVITLAAAAERIDPLLLEAARTLGATPWRRFLDIELPALRPALIATGAILFATCMGAFGTAFTLATQINVLPLTIYNEFTNYANIPAAAALSIILGAATWAILYLAHRLAGERAMAAA